jgi:hypothetical protein
VCRRLIYWLGELWDRNEFGLQSLDVAGVLSEAAREGRRVFDAQALDYAARIRGGRQPSSHEVGRGFCDGWAVPVEIGVTLGVSMTCWGSLLCQQRSRRLPGVASVDAPVSTPVASSSGQSATHRHGQASPATRGPQGLDGSGLAHARVDRAASAGSRNATVEPVPSPTRIPSPTNSAAASATSLFSPSVLTTGR